MKQLQEKLWKNSKPAEDYPKSWYVIPVMDVIDILNEELKQDPYKKVKDGLDKLERLKNG